MSGRAMELGSGLPAWVLRLALLLAGTAAALVQYAGGPLLLTILLVLAVLAAAVPGSPGPALLIVVVAIAVTVTPGAPLRPEVLAEIPLLHLVHVLAAITTLLPRQALVRVSALRRPAIRFAMIQLGAFAVVGLAEILPTGRNSILVEVTGLIAATALVGLAIRALTRSE